MRLARSRALRTAVLALSIALASCGGGGDGGGGTPAMQLSTRTVLFAAAPGGNPSPASQTVTITSSGSAALQTPTATVSAGDEGWLSAAVSGSSPYTLTLTVSSAALAEGPYPATVTVASAGASSQTIDVQLVVETPPGPMTVTGRATYDFVPATYNVSTRVGGLQFPAAVEKPVRNAIVQAVQGTSPLATAVTDANGEYSLSFTPPSSINLSIQVLARTSAPDIAVRDNTDAGALWAMFVPITTSTTTQNLRATHGWTGTTYDPARRVAAPFAILDSMYTAASAFLAVRAPAFPALNVYWSPDNAPTAGSVATGAIGTSHYNPAEKAIYILGKAGVDTDEFDSHVIVHEWGHYFEDNLSRSDSPGGPHGAGDVLDPRLAFGEGYGNALAAMLLPETLYVDTLWQGTVQRAFGFDAETAPSPTDDPSPSVFSEVSVMRALYDLFDGGSSEGYDTVQLGLGGVYDVLTGRQKTTDALTTLGSFVTGVKTDLGTNAAAVDALLAHYGIGAITNDFGVGDTNLQGIFTLVNASTSWMAVFDGRFEPNKRQQNQYYVVTGTGRNVTVTSQSGQDVDLYAYRLGGELAKADSLSGNETITFPTTAGLKYVVSVVGWGETSGTYNATVTFNLP